MLNRKYKAIKISDIEDTILNRILEVRKMLSKGTLQLAYNADIKEEPTLERILQDMDASFLALHRELANAKSQISMLKSQGLSDMDPMVDMLNWQIESAESAFQTRLLELKNDKKLMEKAMNMLRQAKATYDHAKMLRLKLEQNKQAMLMEEAELQRLKKELENKKKNGMSVIYVILGMNALAWIRQQRQRVKLNIEQLRKQTAAMMLTQGTSPNLA